MSAQRSTREGYRGAQNDEPRTLVLLLEGVSDVDFKTISANRQLASGATTAPTRTRRQLIICFRRHVRLSNYLKVVSVGVMLAICLYNL